jgi:hypothetical protein
MNGKISAMLSLSDPFGESVLGGMRLIVLGKVLEISVFFDWCCATPVVYELMHCELESV